MIKRLPDSRNCPTLPFRPSITNLLRKHSPYPPIASFCFMLCACDGDIKPDQRLPRVLRIQELLDGDLSVRAFGLITVCDSGVHQQRYGERTHQRLDVALLTFFQAFRKVYVGENVMHSSKVAFLRKIP